MREIVCGIATAASTMIVLLAAFVPGSSAVAQERDDDWGWVLEAPAKDDASEAVETPRDPTIDPDGATDAELERRPPPAPPEEGTLSKALSDFQADPTLEGRLHFTYRLRYDARYFRFRDYRFPFPGDVTDIDRQFAAELEERHDDNTDQDLDQYLSIRTRDLFTPWEKTGLYQELETEFSLRYFKDIDGTPAGDEAVSTFNALSNEDDFQMGTLNATVTLLDRRLRLTGGRMYINDAAEWVHIDGGKAHVRGLGLFDRPVEFVAFAGQRVTFYSSIDEDEVYGGLVRYFPSRDTRIELSDVYYLDNTFRAELFQRFTPDWNALLVYRQVDEDPESIRVETFFDRSDWGLDLRASYFGKLDDDFNFEYTFSDSASDEDHDRHFNIEPLQPFDEFSLDARQELLSVESGTSLGVFAGGIVHRLRDSDDESVFNSDWYEVWGGLDSLHIPWEGLTGRITLRYVDTDQPRRRPRTADDPLIVRDVLGDGEPDFFGVEFVLEQDFARRVSLGSTLQWRRYSYDSRFAEFDDLDAVSVSGYVRYRPTRILSFYVSYTYEDDYDYFSADFDELHAVRAETVLSW